MNLCIIMNVIEMIMNIRFLGLRIRVEDPDAELINEKKTYSELTRENTKYDKKTENHLM